MNKAQILLCDIGGTAELVAGYGKSYWADSQTSPKAHQRPRKGRGGYGADLKHHFDTRNWELRKAKNSVTARLRRQATVQAQSLRLFGEPNQFVLLDEIFEPTK